MARVSEGRNVFFRLGPAESGRAQCFAVQRGDVKKRINAFYHQPGFRVLDRELNEQCGAMRTLRSLATGLTNGDHGGLNYVQHGVRYLRGQSVTEHGLDLVDELYISEDEHERMLRSEVIPGDVLFTIAGSIGHACVVRGVERANINQAIVRVRPSPEIIPQYLADFLNSKYGKFQSNRLANGGVQLNINFSEVGQIGVPIPPVVRQGELVAAMDAARAERRNKLASVDALLTGLDDYVLALLGLTQPRKDGRKVFAVSMSALGSQARLNADYFHPERILALRALEHPTQELDCPRLEQVVDFIRDQIRTPGPNYLSLANVQSNTGELVTTKEDVTGACSSFQRGDVLFARLRPYLNKVHVAETDGCCSPEFHVLRVKNNKSLRPDYLAAIIRSSLTLAQTRHMMTGNTHPRLTNEDVMGLVIPVPNLGAQEAVTIEARRRREDARRERAEADAGWHGAKQWFEGQLLRQVQS